MARPRDPRRPILTVTLADESGQRRPKSSLLRTIMLCGLALVSVPFGCCFLGFLVFPPPSSPSSQPVAVAKPNPQPQEKEENRKPEKKQPEEKPEEKPEENQPVKKEPAAEEKPEPPVVEKKWHEKGTLHSKSGLEWQRSTDEEDKLATCAVWIGLAWQQKKFKDRIQNSINSPDDIKPYAIELRAALNGAMKKLPDEVKNDEYFGSQKALEFAVLAMALMGWFK